MFIKNEKPVKIIGFPESSMTQEYVEVFSKEGLENFSVIEAEKFLTLKNKEQYQYIVAFCIDRNLRKSICNILDDLNLDCITYIDDSVYTFPSTKIGKGCYIAWGVGIGWDSSIQNHCFIGIRCGIGHHVNIGKNTILFSASWIAGRVNIGNNCQISFKSSVLNKINVCNDVILGAFSNLTKNAEKPGNYVGSIARLMKHKETDKDL